MIATEARPLTATEIRHKAADLIEERGFHQGDYLDEEGESLCAMGALLIAAGVELQPLEGYPNARWTPAASLPPDEAQMAQEEIEAELELLDGWLSEWSDEHSKAEVIAALRGTS